MDVLLIIDVQQGLFNEPRYRQEQVLANINNFGAPAGRVDYPWDMGFMV